MQDAMEILKKRMIAQKIGQKEYALVPELPKINRDKPYFLTKDSENIIHKISYEVQPQ